jgi:carbonic anhydrase
MQDPGHAGCRKAARLSRRAMLAGLGLGIAAVASAPLALAAGDKRYEAMLLNCIDPRLSTYTWEYMTGRGWKNSYSQFTIAGASIGIVAPAFDSWHETFWDNLAISVNLHGIDRVVAITHRDCGAAKVAYGDQMGTDWDFETRMHTEALQTFRAEAQNRQPQLAVDLGIMDLNGNVQPIA